MKKIYTYITCISAFILTALHRKATNGTWKSDKTKQTYVFEEKQANGPF